MRVDVARSTGSRHALRRLSQDVRHARGQRVRDGVESGLVVLETILIRHGLHAHLGSGFGQVEVPGLPAGGPSIDHSLWFHEPIRADAWMLLELWPLKASGSRGVYSGSLRSEDGRLGVLLTQEMLLRDRELPPAMLRRIAEYLGVTPDE